MMVANGLLLLKPNSRFSRSLYGVVFGNPDRFQANSSI